LAADVQPSLTEWNIRSARSKWPPDVNKPSI
jgi:hypothetical protein